MQKATTLILSRKDILPLIDMKQAIQAVEKVFREYGLGRASMPPKIYLDLPQYSGDFRAMPAFASGIGKVSLKWVNTHANNLKIGFPSVMAVLILNDPQTGFPLCIMDGTVLTSIRTGAGGGVAAKFLGRPNSSSVGLVGCGVQARTQLQALRQIFKIQSVKVWGKDKKLVLKFLKDMRRPGEEMTESVTIKDCVENADLVVTTTPSRGAIVKSAWIKPGTHINAIGADAAGKQELDPAILKKARVVVDDFRQASHSGEINVAISKGILKEKDIYAELGHIISGKKHGRSSAKEITVFDSTGLAIQDLAMADLVYRTALRKKKGKRLELI